MTTLEVESINELRRAIREEQQNGHTSARDVAEAIWNGKSLYDVAEFIGETNLKQMLTQEVLRQWGQMRQRDRRGLNGVAVGTTTRLAANPHFWDTPYPLPDGTFKLVSELTPDDVRTLIEARRNDADELLSVAKGMEETLRLAREHRVSTLGALREKGIADLPGFSS